MNTQNILLIRKIFAKVLTLIFFGLAIISVVSLLLSVVEGLLNKENITQVFLSSINTGIIGTVCVALSLEGLIMVIKYSQLDLAGNLYYPVAIIMSTALLLSALGLFIYLTDKRTET